MFSFHPTPAPEDQKLFFPSQCHVAFSRKPFLIPKSGCRASLLPALPPGPLPSWQLPQGPGIAWDNLGVLSFLRLVAESVCSGLKNAC